MGSDAYVGEIALFAGSYIPDGYLPCDGRLLDVRSYQVLFAVIGNKYGGDGVNNFKLPDLRGRVPMGQGVVLSRNYIVGQVGGKEQVTLTMNNLPSHSHNATITNQKVNSTVSLKAFSGNGNETNPQDGIPAVINRTVGSTTTLQDGYTKESPDIGMKPMDLEISLNKIPVEVKVTGNSTPIDNRQPYLVVQFGINYNGDYPIRP